MFKVVAVAGSVVLYLSTYLVGSLLLVLGTTAALAGVIISLTQLKGK